MRELSLNVLDVAQNSISADASLIEICVMENGNKMTISIEDNGKGMDEQQLSKVQDPFFTTRTTRNVGLGVPLFKMAAELTGGCFKIDSAPGKGTAVTAEFVSDSVDMTPLGDINDTMLMLIRFNPNIDFVFKREKNDKSFILDTRKLKKVLGDDVPLDSSDVVQWIKEYLAEETEELLLSSEESSR